MSSGPYPCRSVSVRGLCSAAALVLALALPAGAGLVSDEFAISSGGGSMPDVAYDSVNHRYLVVWAGTNRIWGRFVSDTGVPDPAGEFAVSDAGQPALCAAVAYSETSREFLVTWDGAGRPGGSIFGQLIDDSDGHRKLAGDFVIGTKPGGWRSSVAWNSKDNLYLVVYYSPVDVATVWGQPVHGGGGLKGANFQVSQPGIGGYYPSVSYGRSGDTSRFLVAWDGDTPIQGRRLDGFSGGWLDATPIQITSGTTEDRPSVTYDSGASRWLVQHHTRANGTTDLYGRFVNLDGTLPGAGFPIADTSCFEGETNFGCDIACEPIAGRFFSSFQLECNPPNWVMCGQELARDGSRLGGQVFMVDEGQFFHNAADPNRHRFLVVHDGARIWGRLYGAAPGPVAGFSASPGNRKITLAWTNPSDAHFLATRIVYRADRYPTSPSDGTLVADRPASPGSTDSFAHTGLANHVPCYYSAFTYDSGPNYSELAAAIAVPTENPRVVISSTTFPTSSPGWTTSVWKSSTEPTYPLGHMVWQADVGNPDGCMRSSGDGASDNDDRCTREGGEIKRTISTAGYKSLLLSYDLRVGALSADLTGVGSGTCPVDHNLIDEQLTVFYSTNGGSSWNELGWLRRGELLPVYQRWRTRQIDISAISAANNNSAFALKFRWQFNTHYIYDDYGDLDNVTLSGEQTRVPDARLLSDGAPITLRDKVLCLRQNGFGYIEEQDRTSGIRIETASTTSPGKLVTVAGTMRTTAGGERYIQASSLTPGSSFAAKPLGVTNRDLRRALLDGLYVTTWGTVLDVPESGNYFILSDGSDASGIRVITPAAPAVTKGQFVTITGAAGRDGERVVYLRQ